MTSHASNRAAADRPAALSAARFWRRYAAWSLDASIIALPVLALTWSRTAAGLRDARSAWHALAGDVTRTMIDRLSSSADPLSMALATLSDSGVRATSATLQSALWHTVQPGLSAFVIAAAAYWVTCESSPWQATLGKRALGLRVTDVGGRRIGIVRALARHLAGALSWLTLNLGHLLAAVTLDRRALHDLLAGTRVLQRDAGAPLPAWARAWLATQGLVALAATVWLFAALQDALRQALAGVLNAGF